MLGVTPDNKLKRLITVGDRVLVKPLNQSERTKTGLFLPPTVQEKEQIRSGIVVKVGPGYPFPSGSEYEESWKESEEKIKYMPLQAKEGDMAIFLFKNAIEVDYENIKYMIVPQSSILMLERLEDLLN